MAKKVIWAVVILVIVMVAAGWSLNILGALGVFKTIEPHFSGECTPITGVVGPEDITIHPETGVAYVSSSDWRAAAQGQPANGAIYAYDLKSKTPQLLNLTPAAAPDFHPHGISLYSDKNGRDALFVINHPKGKHTVEIYDLKNGRLSHRKTLSDPMLISPNDLVAVGRNKFYVSNDHRFRPGIMQTLEDFLQLKLSGVVYYDGSRFIKAASGIGYANGINVSADGKSLYLCSVTEGALHVYSRDIASGKLTPRMEIDLGTGVDNIEMDPAGGLWIGAHPQLLKFLQHAKDSSKLSPSQVLHLIPLADGSYDIKEVYLNKGEQISASSVAAVYDKRLLIGAVFDPKFLDCKMAP
jgi:arylesterase/paraoxonase